MYNVLFSKEPLWNQEIVGAGKPVAVQFSIMAPSQLVVGCSVNIGETIKVMDNTIITYFVFTQSCN